MQELWEHQKDTKQFIYENWTVGNKHVLIMLPTGAGKTILAKSIISDAIKKKYKTLTTSHRRILVEQIYTEFYKFGSSVVMGRDKRYNKDALLQIGSLHTIKNRELDYPNIIVIDEVHWGYKTDLLKSVFKRFGNSYIIGLSATPIDDFGYLLDGFDAYFDKYQMKDLQKLKYSVPFVVYSPVKIDLSSVRVGSDNEYIQSELEEVMIREYLLNTVVENYIKFGENRKFLAFATTQKHAKLLQDAFISSKIKTGYIDSNTPDKERKTILSDLKSGIIRGVVNIDILTTGFDEPSVSCLIAAAPRMRLKTYIQEVGRGSRIFEGKKDCIYIDCANNVETHGMPDERREFKFKPAVSRVVDRKLGIESDISERNAVISDISSEKYVFLKKIGKLLDIYDGREYKLEKELQSDVNKYLEKTDLFWYRQNSGVAQYSYALRKELLEFKRYNPVDVSQVEKFINFINKGAQRFVRFTSKSGLADVSCFMGSLYFAIELKLPTGKLTDHQKVTFPEMVKDKVLLFFAESVIDVYDIIVWVEKHWNGSVLNDEVYRLYEKQIEYYKKHKLKTYDECHRN